MTAVHTREVGWNGIRLSVPHDWEVIVKEPQNILFEDDFKPQLQLRWEHTGPLKLKEIEKRGQRFWSSPSIQLNQTQLPAPFKALQKKNHTFIFFGEKKNEQGIHSHVSGGLRYCQQSETLIVFQFLNTNNLLSHKFAHLLGSLHLPQAEETLWSVQDFSLKTPKYLKLDSYTFGAGLTRLSFTGPKFQVECCKLGPADLRLKTQSFHEILGTLCGATDIEFLNSDSAETCVGYRHPNLLRQILHRLKREKPFIAGKLWHNTDANRLLAVVLSSKATLTPSTLDAICNRYEILS